MRGAHGDTPPDPCAPTVVAFYPVGECGGRCASARLGPMAVDLLQSLPDEERRALWSCMRRCRFTPREIVFREGDPADSLHFIVKGHFSARVTTPTGDTVILRVLGQGDLLGEYALIENAQRSATVA